MSQGPMPRDRFDVCRWYLCRRLFVSAHRARYCSHSCRQMAYQRRRAELRRELAALSEVWPNP